MATFPSYVTVLLDGHTESHSQIAERADMDRGVPKQRRTQSDVIVTFALTLLFLNTTDAEAFEDWYYGDAAAGAAQFDFWHPRTGALLSARVVANSLGALQALGGGRSRRSIQIEYLKALTL